MALWQVMVFAVGVIVLLGLFWARSVERQKKTAR